MRITRQDKRFIKHFKLDFLTFRYAKAIRRQEYALEARLRTALSTRKDQNNG